MRNRAAPTGALRRARYANLRNRATPALWRLVGGMPDVGLGNRELQRGALGSPGNTPERSAPRPAPPDSATVQACRGTQIGVPAPGVVGRGRVGRPVRAGRLIR